MKLPSGLKAFRFQAVICAFVAGLFAPVADAGLIGALEQKVIDTYRLGETLDFCDFQADQKSIRLNLARALDKRELELDDFARGVGRPRRGTSGNELTLGPVFLAPRLSVGKTGVNGWVSEKQSWEDLDREFQELRGQRVNGRWVRLLGRVRAMISDDYRRGVRGVWFGVSAEGVAEAPALVTRVTDCLKEKKCDGLANSEPFQHALRLTRKSERDFSDYRTAATDAARGRALKNLLAEIRPFVNYFEPVKQAGVRFTDASTLVVPLDAGDFRGYENAFAAFAEGFWKVAGHVLRIEWTVALRNDPTFRFFYLPNPKDGSLIDYGRRSISLGQGASESMPAHLVGRAIGFRARAFPVWHSATCEYEDQTKPGDLLSDGRSGSVTAAHWNSLKRAYAEKP